MIVEPGVDAGGGFRARFASVAQIPDEARIPHYFAAEARGWGPAASEVALDSRKQMHGKTPSLGTRDAN